MEEIKKTWDLYQGFGVTLEFFALRIPARFEKN